MDGLFGIEIARRALQASQYAMDVTAHNIANANTDGYTRQRAILGTTEPFPSPEWNRPLLQGQLGTGVEVKSIDRVREGYFDDQIRKENQSLGEWNIKDNALKQLETIINEPSDSGLSSIMGGFWNSWQELSTNPESLTLRSAVVQNGSMLATQFNQLDQKLSRLQDSLNDQVAVDVSNINDITQQIAEINQEVARVKAYGANPNDQLDQRDQLLDQLSKLANVQISELNSGVTEVYLNGTQLVSQYGANQLQVVSNASNNGYYDVTWASDGTKATINGGELKGLIDTRDNIIPNKYRADLNTLANTIVTQVNQLHKAGYGLDGNTGYNFFDPTKTTAATIALSSDVSDPNHVAAASSWPAGGAPGDNTNALAIGQLKDALLMSGNTITMDDYYRSTVTNLGIDSQESSKMVANAQSYYNLIENHRQSVSGVSLDEEATNMIKYQKAYEAAAKLVTVFDSMLDTLINKMGS